MPEYTQNDMLMYLILTIIHYSEHNMYGTHVHSRNNLNQLTAGCWSGVVSEETVQCIAGLWGTLPYPVL